jgi:hypothetical protein
MMGARVGPARLASPEEEGHGHIKNAGAVPAVAAPFLLDCAGERKLPSNSGIPQPSVISNRVAVRIIVSWCGVRLS